MNMKLIKADTDLFAIYQIIYSDVDTEMSYDWNERLGDTNWAKDQCYFLELDGAKVGGAVITDDTIFFPFLIPPFADRAAFWKYLLKLAPRPNLSGMLDVDREILPMFNYETVRTQQIMVRPADVLDLTLPAGFECLPIGTETEIKKVAEVLRASFLDGIVYEKMGQKTLEEVIQEVKHSLEYVNVKNSSYAIIETETDKMVGVCLAGIGEQNTLGYSFIDELGFLPEFQGKGLAKYLVSRVVTDSYGIAPFVKLGIIVGNNAEFLYNQLGFKAGVRWSMMRCRKE